MDIFFAVLLMSIIALPNAWADQPTYSLGVNTADYFDSSRSYFPKTAAKTNLTLQAGTRGDYDFNSTFKAGWDVDTEYSFNEKWNYFRPHEVYGQVDLGSLRLWFGRKKLTYSQWEERWNTGLFQPRFTDDKLHSTTAGNIGVFAGQDVSNFHFRAGFLPISIPEMGPNFTVADGEPTSRSPWFHAPPASFVYGGQLTNIEYSVDQPDTWSTIAKPGGVLQAEYAPSEDFFTRTSAAYKPMPQILLAFPVVLQLPGTGFVELHPRILYHEVINQDVVLKSGGVEYGVSAAYEHPIKDNVSDAWEQQNLGDATIASAYATTALSEDKSWHVTGSLLKVWGGDKSDTGPVETKLTLFDKRYEYTEAVSAEIRKSWSVGFSAGFKIVFDHLQNGLIYSGDASWMIGHGLSLKAAFDYFDLAPGGASQPDGFIDVYRGNDRAFIGVNYGY